MKHKTAQIGGFVICAGSWTLLEPVCERNEFNPIRDDVQDS